MKNERYYITPSGKVGKFVRLAGTGNQYVINVDGKEVTYHCSHLTFLPSDKLSWVRNGNIFKQSPL